MRLQIIKPRIRYLGALLLVATYAVTQNWHTSAAGSNSTARRAEVATILADHCMVSAFRAELALGWQYLVAG